MDDVDHALAAAVGVEGLEVLLPVVVRDGGEVAFLDAVGGDSPVFGAEEEDLAFAVGGRHFGVVARHEAHVRGAEVVGVVAIDHVEDILVADLPCQVQHFVAHVDGLYALDALAGEVDEGVFAAGFDIAVVAPVLEQVDHVDMVEAVVGVLGAVAGGARLLNPEDFVVAEFLRQFLLAVFVDAP